ncbi:MAG: hypothetical protein COW24_05740 [Candidatus Kerfeldbacteria bacterium CG15_BIG_FIL_POST_REV_8_21_14_020_45_12]|uniref:Uncharacterized protein n=1 Tax=Candidatus Kerfeldbacteria bacterium CG15_BIG_FIL_POST_REV_8_21_14_020_45_12 TaxID=2014247 RepID=A0A2M7H297_9BACT|nr:MAG: hypothetical protein COW24_05740 [Candidatus Kerfeldbacteria bacterium CG15_BIG_FIL_POST_REV_8_21_14_020_45_12]PJA93531.1 MAG: hypothetical protein CO132_02780 [Candidatus Kerfeldbacteria bacterium CG_4_9_14_3_um_filter_45_8]
MKYARRDRPPQPLNRQRAAELLPGPEATEDITPESFFTPGILENMSDFLKGLQLDLAKETDPNFRPLTLRRLYVFMAGFLDFIPEDKVAELGIIDDKISELLEEARVFAAEDLEKNKKKCESAAEESLEKKAEALSNYCVRIAEIRHLYPDLFTQHRTQELQDELQQCIKSSRDSSNALALSGALIGSNVLFPDELIAELGRSSDWIMVKLFLESTPDESGEYRATAALSFPEHRDEILNLFEMKDYLKRDIESSVYNNKYTYVFQNLKLYFIFTAPKVKYTHDGIVFTYPNKPEAQPLPPRNQV